MADSVQAAGTNTAAVAEGEDVGYEHGTCLAQCWPKPNTTAVDAHDMFMSIYAAALWLMYCI